MILTKHNLLKRNWDRNKSFVFCSRDENSTLLRVSVCSVHVVDDTSCFGSQMPFECDGYPSHDWHKQRGRSNKTLLLTHGAVICWTLWILNGFY